MFQKTKRKFILPIEKKEAYQGLNERSLIEIKKKMNELGLEFLSANAENQDQLFERMVLHTIRYITLEQANKLLLDNHNLIVSVESPFEKDSKHLSDLLQETSATISEDNLKKISKLSVELVNNAIALDRIAKINAGYYGYLAMTSLFLSISVFCVAVFATLVLAILSAEGVIPLVFFGIMIGSILGASLVGFCTSFIIEQFKSPYLKESARLESLLSEVNDSGMITNGKLAIKIDEICESSPELYKNSMFRTKLEAIHEPRKGKSSREGYSIMKLYTP